MRRKDRVKVQVWAGAAKSPQPSHRISWKTLLFTSAALLGAVGFVVGGSWLAVRLIVNPAAVGWLSRLFPVWEQPVTPPQTMQEIKAEIAETGGWVDQPFYLSNDPDSNQSQPRQEILLPVLRPRKHCAGWDATQTKAKKLGCGEIAELRIYRQNMPQRFGQGSHRVTYDLIDRISVMGPEELSAIASLAQADITEGTTRTLPLTTLQAIDGKAPTADFWFHLSGEWKRGTRVLYGQVIRYDPQRRRLYSMQNWSSPAGQLPYWQQVTGSPVLELVVNQSLGLEPQFQVYQYKRAESTAQPTHLEAIVLTEAALNERAYLHGLLLARKGLWSPAQSLLQTVKQTGKWSTTAQAQLDLIGLHAKVTRTQAERDWASPTQQILAQLIDGQWSKALSAVKTAHASGYDVRNLLSTNVDRLWPRIEVALRVNARQADLQQWGLLVLAVKQNREQALAWLKKQPSLPKLPLQQTLALLEPSPLLADKTPSVAASPSPAAPNPTTSALIGTVVELPTLKPADWALFGEATLTLPTGHRWYQIQVIEFLDGQSWQQVPFARANPSAGQQARQLGQRLGLDRVSVQLVAWQGAIQTQTLPISVRAIQFKQGKLSLLGIAPPLATAKPPANSATLIAITPQTMTWVQPLSSATLNDLAQTQPAWDAAMTALWQDLQTAQLVSTAAVPDAAELTETIGNWSIQKMELTGDRTAEVVLTIEATAGKQPRTVIFADQGQVIYSDLNQDQSIVAMLSRTLEAAPSLIVTTPQGVKLQQWSNQNQRFE